jgi:hypothetical protein
VSGYTRIEAMTLPVNCQLARMKSECPFIGPEPTCDISAGVATKTVTEWINRKQRKCREFITGHKHLSKL